MHHNGIVGVRGSTPLGSTKFESAEPDLILSTQDREVVQAMWENGVSLAQVWSEWRRLYLASPQRVKACFQLFLKHIKDSGRSPQYCKEFGWALNKLGLFMDTELPLCQVTTKSWWRSLDAMRAGNTVRRKVSVFLNWCLRQGFIKEPIHIPGKPSCPEGDIEVLTNDEVSSLIKSCPSDLLGHLWLCLCMGLRVAEASRVKHLKITATHLVVGAQAAKTKTRRVLDIPEHHGHYTQLIRPQINLRKRMEALRLKAGLSRWPRNCMRHTAASHWLNRLQSAESTALHLGNSPVMLHRHYKALVTRQESTDFFDLWVGF